MTDLKEIEERFRKHGQTYDPYYAPRRNEMRWLLIEHRRLLKELKMVYQKLEEQNSQADSQAI